ncbi:hypothetical protein H4S02_010407, partial [Coemansia sp. RSA 2611]
RADVGDARVRGGGARGLGGRRVKGLDAGNGRANQRNQIVDVLWRHCQTAALV